MILVRSLVFQVYFYVSVSLFAIGMIFCRFMPYQKQFKVAHWWGRSMMVAGRWICGFSYSIQGRENIPDEACVIMCKHTSVFETYAQLAIFPPQTWVVKRELFWIPFFGWGLASMRPIAINRSAGRAAVTQVIEQGKKLLAMGVSITIFPEGTRVPPGETRKYGISGAALAREAGVRILPVAHNAGDLWPRRGVLKKPGLITVIIGPPIDASTQSPKETNRIVQDWVEDRMAEISPSYFDKSAAP
ncbi:MAG: 1-acyl-sn-glycerol-3-phosphate acyltransferase [Gammaproteobacteria bacterium]|nr:1-acyl-sn-glycerol-3-phosphate acyltransferase [Gammaproteobacteria bacterium]